MATVLLVEPSQTMRRVVEWTFKGSGHEVVGVSSATEAQQAVLQLGPSVILVSYLLPDCSGIDFCRSIKSNERTALFPVVVLGGTFSPFDEAEALASGADAVVVKPFTTASLFEPVQAIFERAPMTGFEPVGAGEPAAVAEVNPYEDDLFLDAGPIDATESVVQPPAPEELMMESAQPDVESPYPSDVPEPPPAFSAPAQVPPGFEPEYVPGGGYEEPGAASPAPPGYEPPPPMAPAPPEIVQPNYEEIPPPPPPDAAQPYYEAIPPPPPPEFGQPAQSPEAEPADLSFEPAGEEPIVELLSEEPAIEYLIEAEETVGEMQALAEPVLEPIPDAEIFEEPTFVPSVEDLLEEEPVLEPVSEEPVEDELVFEPTDEDLVEEAPVEEDVEFDLSSDDREEEAPSADFAAEEPPEEVLEVEPAEEELAAEPEQEEPVVELVSEDLAVEELEKPVLVEPSLASEQVVAAIREVLPSIVDDVAQKLLDRLSSDLQQIVFEAVQRALDEHGEN